MKNLFCHNTFTMLTCLFVVAMVCFMSFPAIAAEEVDPALEQAWREVFEWHMREEERRTGKKYTDEELEQAWPEYLEAKKEILKKKVAMLENENMDLYMKGRVVDQNGSPVSGAKLEFYSLRYSGYKQAYKEFFPVTDSNGDFVIANHSGLYIGFNDIVPPAGYQYLPEHQAATSFYPDTDLTQGEDIEYYDTYPKSHKGRYYYDSKKHIVKFKLWKKVHAKQERLVQNDFSGQFDIGGGWYTVNFFSLVTHEDFSKVADPNADVDGDILFKADFSEDRKNVILTIAPVQGGVIENADEALIAPEAGYMPTKTYELAANKRGDFSTLLFTRSRGDRIYARMRLSIGKHLKPEKERSWLVIGGKFIANPQGSRNLEPWGPRFSCDKKLAARDWKQPGFDDFKERLEENQAEQMMQLESSYMCQIEDGGVYYKGYLGTNQTFYKYIGAGKNQKHGSVPLIAKPRYTVDIEPQKTLTYISGLPKGRGGGAYMGFVFDDKKLALHFTKARVRKTKTPSFYLPAPTINIRRLEHEKFDFEVVEMVKPQKAK